MSQLRTALKVTLTQDELDLLIEALRLSRVAIRLYSEVRLDGDAMRDLAQAVDAIVRVCRELELSEEGRTSSPRLSRTLSPSQVLGIADALVRTQAARPPASSATVTPSGPRPRRRDDQPTWTIPAQSTGPGGGEGRL